MICGTHKTSDPTDAGTVVPVAKKGSSAKKTSSSKKHRTRAIDVHEWISFTDPTEDRTWTFDATYLMSNHRCIFGEGCKGVLDADATEMMQGCCSYGAHFVDEDDVQTVVKAFIKVKPEHMQFYDEAVKQGFLDAGEPDSDGSPVTTTRLVDDACIFLNRPGFNGGSGCALHIAALEAGARPLDWKPNVCWQVPMRLEHATDETGHVVSQLREWKRRDWGDGGSEFHWWCTEAPEAFSHQQPVYRSLRDEIVELIGEDIYALMVSELERATWTPLPHPVVRGNGR
jgi:hypothetical protein